MKVLGIDPGSRVMGLGLVSQDGDRLRCVYRDSIKAGNGELSERLRVIFDAVSDVAAQFKPDVVAVEQVFVGQNIRSALILGHARGSAICAAVSRSLPVSEYSARQIKQAVVGSGAATKDQVQHMVRVLLGLSSAPPADAADALACAICHINSQSVSERIALNGILQ